MDDLILLADLIKAKNAVDNIIANLVGRPAQIGHVGEYIAATIFGITINDSASHKDFDGYFSNGPLANCTVNIKWHTKRDGLLDLKEATSTDYYLVFTGPKSAPGSSRGISHPWTIENVFLFDAQKLNNTLKTRGTKIGVASSVPGQFWQEAEIYPVQSNTLLPLSSKQIAQLVLFHPTKIGSVNV